jgi:hypothetical protein
MAHISSISDSKLSPYELEKLEFQQKKKHIHGSYVEYPCSRDSNYQIILMQIFSSFDQLSERLLFDLFRLHHHFNILVGVFSGLSSLVLKV